MRKRIASINEVPITAEERRVAVGDAAGAAPNRWLAEQGLSAAVGGAGFPLGGGSEPCY